MNIVVAAAVLYHHYAAPILPACSVLGCLHLPGVGGRPSMTLYLLYPSSTWAKWLSTSCQVSVYSSGALQFMVTYRAPALALGQLVCVHDQLPAHMAPVMLQHDSETAC